jgi:hypothetical protein
MVSVASDGNCQFRAASHQLFGTDQFFGHVRQRALAYIEADLADFMVPGKKRIQYTARSFQFQYTAHSFQDI